MQNDATAEKKEALKERRTQCGSDLCRDNIDRELEELMEKEQKLNCEIAMAMEELLEDCDQGLRNSVRSEGKTAQTFGLSPSVLAPSL